MVFTGIGRIKKTSRIHKNQEVIRGLLMNVLKIILAIILPPVAAFMQVGASTHLWINIVLTILGGVPGIIHALWLVLTNQQAK